MRIWSSALKYDYWRAIGHDGQLFGHFPFPLGYFVPFHLCQRSCQCQDQLNVSFKSCCYSFALNSLPCRKMVNVMKGILVKCDPAMKQFLLHLDEKLMIGSKFILQDLDETHLFISAEALEPLKDQVRALNHDMLKVAPASFHCRLTIWWTKFPFLW